MKPEKREDLYRIYWYDADITGTVKASAICNYLQESAWRHAVDLGFGFYEMRGKKQVWVIVSFVVKMEALPQWGEKIRVETWPRKIDRFIAMRDFRIYSDKHMKLGAATSSWMVLNLDSRRPCKLDDLEIIAGNHISSDNALGEDAPLLKSEGGLEKVLEHTVQYSEIDHNGHVNNTRYIDWCYNSIPSDFHRKKRFETLTINYLSEVKEEEKIEINRKELPGERYSFEGARRVSGKQVFRAEISWLDRK